MKFFDSLIDELEGLISPHGQKAFPAADAWQDAGQSQVIMRRDTAFELEGVGFNLVTSKEITDGIVLIGDDLDAIKENRSFCRVSIVQVGDEGDEQKTYNLIKKTEYVKYRFFPDGYMMRSTSRTHKEAVRVSKKAVKSGISFQKIGALLISKYKENPAVKGVKVIFITTPDADFSLAEKLAVKNYEIAETLNKVMNSVNFDCSTCNLKAVCDEVEGMKELHFKTSMGK